MRKALVAGSLVVGVVAAGLVGSAGGAAAATQSELSLTSVSPGVAKVCWTPYVPDAGTVTDYRLRSPEIADASFAVSPEDIGADGKYCVSWPNLVGNTWYNFSLEVEIDNGAFVPAAPVLESRGYSLSAVFSRTQVKAGAKVTVSGVLKSGEQQKVQPHADVLVQRRLLPEDVWSTVGTATTDANGRYNLTFKVHRNMKVRTYFEGFPAGDPTVGAWNSNNEISASPSFSISFTKNPVKFGRSVRVSGTVTAGSLAFLAGDPVCLQEKSGKSWRSLACVEISSEGKFSRKLTPKSKADLRYRWRATSVAPEYVAGNGPKRRLVVR
jgi:5-hydroxyisourate hydrolase-like protein (transthyretin family)